MAGKKKQQASKKPIGIRLDKKIIDLLAEASTAAGVSRTEIIEECVKAYASDYVAYTFEQRKTAFDEYLKTAKSKK